MDQFVETEPQFPWRKFCHKIFAAALDAVNPYKTIINNVSLQNNVLKVSGGKSFNLKNFRKIFVIGAGKGAFTMASAFEEILGDNISKGLVITKTDHGGYLEHIEVVEGTHPLPSKKNVECAGRIIEIAKSADRETLVIFLISGGASALLPAPIDGICLEDKLKVTEILMSCGASIKEINCIRKHLSRVKGGKLLKMLKPATTLSIILSDVVGDSLHTIGSGPLISDPSTLNDAIEICRKFEIENQIPPLVRAYLQQGAESKVEEALSEDDSSTNHVSHVLIGTNTIAITAAAEKASELDFNVEILSTTFQGEARELAGFFGALGRHRINDLKKPLLLLGGGETTVSLRGTGKGGRNQEFALAMVPLVAQIPSSFAAGFATDGTDGPTDAAGAWCDSQSLKSAEQKKLSPAHFLRDNNSYAFFKEMNDLIITGPTGTNVCDIYLLGLH
jgi:hydroxypyruvate reductase